MTQRGNAPGRTAVVVATLRFRGVDAFAVASPWCLSHPPRSKLTALQKLEGADAHRHPSAYGARPHQPAATGRRTTGVPASHSDPAASAPVEATQHGLGPAGHAYLEEQTSTELRQGGGNTQAAQGTGLHAVRQRQKKRRPRSAAPRARKADGTPQLELHVNYEAMLPHQTPEVSWLFDAQRAWLD